MKKLFLFISIIAITSCNNNKFINVDDATLINANNHPQEWLIHGLNYNQDRYSLLTQINKTNVNTLGLAWVTDLESKRGLETTPLIANGVMFVTGVWSNVYAMNAKTGKIIWHYNPKVTGAQAEKLCCDIVNRGVAMYKEKIYVGTLDGRLIALNATDGKLIWSV